MNTYVKNAIYNINNGFFLKDYEYSELMKCARYGGPDGQAACDALAKASQAEKARFQRNPFQYIRNRANDEEYYVKKGRLPWYF